MDYFQIIILGIIQGITEWLPISSQAMVFLFGRFVFDLGHIEALKISIWLHSGTLLAVIVYFWKDILRILTSIFKKDSSDKKTLFFLILATVMSGIVAFPFFLLIFWIELPEAPFTIIIGLFLIIVALSQKKSRELKKEEKSLSSLKKQDGLIVGTIQGFAVLPGLSRSGLTIATLLFQRYSLKDAFYLSFLMSIPIIFLAQIALPFFGNEKEFIIDSTLLIGALTAGLVGFITIKTLLQFAEKVNFFKTTLILGIITILLGIILFIG
jgi:undecaprenyl-diphosphatase